MPTTPVCPAGCSTTLDAFLFLAKPLGRWIQIGITEQAAVTFVGIFITLRPMLRGTKETKTWKQQGKGNKNTFTQLYNKTFGSKKYTQYRLWKHRTIINMQWSFLLHTSIDWWLSSIHKLCLIINSISYKCFICDQIGVFNDSILIIE